METAKVNIEVFVTKTRKFRAQIKEPNGERYQVTIGGKNWCFGKGRQYEDIIKRKVIGLMLSLNTELSNIKWS